MADPVTVDTAAPAQALLAMTLGVAQTQALRAAAELNLADLLASGPMPAAADGVRVETAYRGGARGAVQP